MTEPTTLDELMRQKPMDIDMTVLVATLREQRTRWLANQAIGSRKLVRAKDVPLKPAPLELDLAGVKPARIIL